MNEIATNAQLAALCEQRNAALNAVVVVTSQLAVAHEQIKGLTAQLEAATALVAATSEVVAPPPAKTPAKGT